MVFVTSIGVASIGLTSIGGGGGQDNTHYKGGIRINIRKEGQELTMRVGAPIKAAIKTVVVAVGNRSSAGFTRATRDSNPTMDTEHVFFWKQRTHSGSSPAPTFLEQI